jgi:hypothetical protein
MSVTNGRAQFGPPGYETDLLYLACLAGACHRWFRADGDRRLSQEKGIAAFRSDAGCSVKSWLITKAFPTVGTTEATATTSRPNLVDVGGPSRIPEFDSFVQEFNFPYLAVRFRLVTPGFGHSDMPSRDAFKYMFGECGPSER